ncbi:MAG: AAA family ATPase [Bacteroidia bacterium]
MSTNKTTELSIARQKKNIAWMLFMVMLSFASFTTYKWYAEPNDYSTASTVSVPGENTPADFWTNTGLVSAKTRATEIISSETFVTSAFQNQPAPALTSVTYDYSQKTEAERFPFEIVVTKAPTTGSQSFIITDAGDNSYLLKGGQQNPQKSFIGTYNTEVQLDGYAFTVNKKNEATITTTPIHTETVFSFSLLSSHAMAEYLLSGNGDLEVSQLNDVIQVHVTAQGDAFTTGVANTLASAYVHSTQGASTESLKTTSTQVEQVTPSIDQPTKEIEDNQIGTLVERLTELEAAQTAQESLTRNIRERIEEDYSDLSTDGIDNEDVVRGMRKLGELYDRLDRHPEDADIIASISERKQKIGNDLIEARKETAIQIEKTKESLKELGAQAEDHSNYAVTTADRLMEQKSPLAATSALLIPATTMEAQKNTPTWAWLTAVLGLSLLFMSNRVTVFQNRYRLIKNSGVVARTNKLPVTYPVKTVTGTNVALTQPVENLCAEILSKDQIKTITVTSLKGGEGKTFVVSRLAMCLAALDKKVLVIDMSFHQPTLSKTISCETEYNISDVASGQCELLQAVTPSSLPGMDLLTAGSFEHGIRGFLAWTDRETSFKQLRNYYDYIIIDTDDVSSGPEAVTFLKMSDMNLFIDGSGGTGREKNEKIAEFASEKGLLNTFVVPNIITRKAPINKTVKPAVRNTPKTVRMTSEEHVSTQNDGEAKKPSLLKRVALWFF